MFYYMAWIVIDAVIIFLAYFLLYTGVHRVAAFGASKRAWLMLVVGSLLCVGSVVDDYVPYSVASKSLELLKARIFTEDVAPHAWSPKLTGENRELLGYNMALEEFYKTGTLTTYADRTNRPIVFVPNQENIRDREFFVAGQAELAEMIRVRQIAMVQKACWAVLAVVVAIIVGLRSRRQNKRDGESPLLAS